MTWLVILAAALPFLQTQTNAGEMKKRRAARIVVVDANGREVPSGRPSGTSQTFDVAVGPSGQLVFSPSMVSIHIGDQGDRRFLRKLKDRELPFDIIVDDGSHLFSDQAATFEEMVFHLRLGQDDPREAPSAELRDNIHPLDFAHARFERAESPASNGQAGEPPFKSHAAFAVAAERLETAPADIAFREAGVISAPYP
jgi:hypothetical protein